jgi:hypothetical protein
MEDLIRDDATFEVFANSEGAQLLENRFLTTYPSEKSSFQVDLGFDGYSNFENPKDDSKKDDTKKDGGTKIKLDTEKLQQGLTSLSTAVTSGATAYQALKGDGSKPPKRRKLLKEACGRKPLVGKEKKKIYNDCVAKYNADNLAGRMSAPETTPLTPQSTTPESESSSGNTKKIVIGLVVVGVLVTAFIGFKKGWFAGKAK